MRRNELTIALVLAVIGVLVAFWLVILGPKRQEASGLKDDVGQLHSELSQAQEAASAGQQARESFSSDYRKLVVMGKAVPQDGDQASLLVQLQNLADRSGVQFEAIDLSDSSSSSSTPAPTTTPAPSASSDSSTATPPSDSSSTSTSATSTSSGSSVPAETTVTATEASAATLPIGASIGPAGLPVMKYELTFNGGFFQIADFMKRVDDMVRTPNSSRIVVDGRLMTVDAFTLAPVNTEGAVDVVPTLTANLSVTTYLTPSEQGITDGASPSGPAPATTPSATPTPASSTETTTPAPTTTPTSSTTP
jgi:type II secretory pathway pseudopilin PulG